MGTHIHMFYLCLFSAMPIARSRMIRASVTQPQGDHSLMKWETCLEHVLRIFATTDPGQFWAEIQQFIFIHCINKTIDEKPCLYKNIIILPTVNMT